ncbi:tRNA (adenosine(37)-N6)-threonylcarbamoyltransferase complex ATPase subunit type 1 TsaE [Glaesserella sp.]|uniref:tRNA (adenosine(37)-N6)-threonylcarbamoyltransferase complex ATPase subunit type 1 TsaE n=1 Tax=Glaesserella sp. TaxID=2094731 RepID=UPI0035A1C937
MTKTQPFYVENEAQMLQFGAYLADELQAYLAASPTASLVIYLNGELGAGKTTLTRSIVQRFGHNGNVKSPTYTLVEEYQLSRYSLYHFDLYRLADPEELEFMGIRDYFGPQTICLFEWASRGEGMIPPADLVIQIDYQSEGRKVTLQPQNNIGQHIFAKFLEKQTA